MIGKDEYPRLVAHNQAEILFQNLAQNPLTHRLERRLIVSLVDREKPDTL